MVRATKNDLLTVPEVAALLRISVGATYSLVTSGRIPHLRLGPRTIRFERGAVEAWLAEQSAAGLRR